MALPRAGSHVETHSQRLMRFVRMDAPGNHWMESGATLYRYYILAVGGLIDQLLVFIKTNRDKITLRE